MVTAVGKGGSTGGVAKPKTTKNLIRGNKDVAKKKMNPGKEKRLGTSQKKWKTVVASSGRSRKRYNNTPQGVSINSFP